MTVPQMLALNFGVWVWFLWYIGALNGLVWVATYYAALLANYWGL